jgi:hypothetical protein
MYTIFIVQFIQKCVLLERFHHLLIAIGRRDMIRFKMFGTKQGEESRPSAQLENVLPLDQRSPLFAQEIRPQMQRSFPGSEACGVGPRYQITSFQQRYRLFAIGLEIVVLNSLQTSERNIRFLLHGSTL